MTKFYIADTHFGHQAVIKMCNRPFESVSEMDQVLINNWNQVIGEDDEVYIIGDFMYRTKQSPSYYLDQLKGRKHLITGNHERWLKNVDQPHKYFDSIAPYAEINDEGCQIILFHYPIAEWAYYYRNSIHIFGHIHNSRTGPAFELYKNQPNMLNAGVDLNHFTPVTLKQLQINNEWFKQEV